MKEKLSIVDQLIATTPQYKEVAQVIFNLFSQMVISQLLVNKIEWNKFHLVANLIAFKINTNLITLQFFPGDDNPIV